MSVSQDWGTEPGEHELPFPCDWRARAGAEAYYRGVSIDATPEAVFRWLCQMRVAPYSYDWIDNRGRKSPPKLIAGLDDLEPGQEFMGVFELVEFESGRHVTLRTKPTSRVARAFGKVWVSYLIVPSEPNRCRLLVKLLVEYPRGWMGRWMRLFFPWGDLIMMRRQLLNFKRLAEESAAPSRSRIKPQAVRPGRPR